MPNGGGGSSVKGMSGSGSSSVANSRKELWHIDCPHCGVPVIKIRSKKKETFGEVFFKCSNNIKEDPSTCGFIRSEEQYEMYMRGLDHRSKKGQGVNLEAVDEGHCFGDENRELKHELVQLKQQLDSAVGEIWRLKLQVLEVKEQLGVKKKESVLDNVVVVVVCVGVLVGIVVTNMWKS